MTVRDRLRVRVNDELLLDAGICEEVQGRDGPERLIRPPETTLFQQVLAYLRTKPDPPKRQSGSMVGRDGVAAAALVLRWGSYLAVLLDRGKPAWSGSLAVGTSRISDGERSYAQLVDRAVYYLPMPRKTAKLKVTELATLANPAMAARVVQSADATRLERVRADAERYPSRLLANALVNTAWRNGPIEDIHAGGSRGYPLDQRRVTPAEERELMGFMSERLALGMTVCLQLAMEQPRRPWSEQVLPYGLAEILMITPSRWTLTGSSREVRLPAAT